MKPEIIDYTAERLKIVEDELKSCADPIRIEALKKIKESILKFMESKKVKLKAA